MQIRNAPQKVWTGQIDIQTFSTLMIHKNVLSLIGNTPLVRINKINPCPDVIIAGKMEKNNPGGSIKERVALAMIEAAERSGDLTGDKIVIEATSGNTGIGLAMVCAVKGYRLKLIMPESASEERKRIMQAYGAEIVLTPGHLSTDGAIEEAYRLSREEPDTYVLMDQFNNPASIEAHYTGTAEEIWEQTEGNVTHVIATLGTSGTAMGTAKRLKELSPDVQVIALEPYAGHKIQGLKNMQESYPPGIFDKSTVDRIIHVEDEEAFETCRKLASEEGLFVGMSSGAALAGALKIAGELEKGLVVAIFPDGGERYLSTPLFAQKAKQGVSLFDLKTKSKQLIAEDTITGFFTFGPGPDRTGDLEVWRRIVFFDVLARYLGLREGKSDVVVALADLDDQTLSGAREQGVSLELYAAGFLENVTRIAKLLHVSEKTRFISASQSVDTMLHICRKLLGTGQGYEKLRSVYFDVHRDPNYGSLGRMDLSKLSLGKTVDLENYSKEDPMDFTLLKRATLQDLKRGECIKTEWGNVRPSWYLQMAAVATDSLESITGVLGGQSHWFPHLENIRAIWSQGLKVDPKVWATTGSLEGKNGNGETPEVQDVKVSPFVLRMWLLSSSYHKPLTFSRGTVAMWSRNWKRVQSLAEALCIAKGTEGGINEDIDQAVFDLKSGLVRAIEDDMSLHHFWPVVFNFCRQINKRLNQGQLTRQGVRKSLEQLKVVDNILGFLDWSKMPIPEEKWPEEIAQWVQNREKARREKEFSQADALRDSILDAGFVLEDTAEGPRLYRRSSSDVSVPKTSG